MKPFRNCSLALLCFLFSLFSFSQSKKQTEAEVLVNKLRQTENLYQSKKIIKDILKSDADYDHIVDDIRNKIKYSDNVERGYIEWKYVIDSIDYLTIIFVPENYNPDNKYQISFFLHGAASSFNAEAVKLYVNKDTYNCDSLQRILVYPGCWALCPWWHERQTENLNYVLNELKTIYNIDENNVHLTGVSDGGTGIIYQANLGVTPWASFRPYISNPEGLKGLSNKNIFIKNLGNRPFLFISSEEDQLFPPNLMNSFLKKMDQSNNPYQYILVPNFKHEISWLPLYHDTILNFVQKNIRVSYPSSLFWQTENAKYGRNHWVIINKISNKNRLNHETYPIIKAKNISNESPSGIIKVNATENIINVKTINVKQYTLLLSPEQFDFDKEILVYTNDKLSFQGFITKDLKTLLKWYKKDLDRTMLFGNELTLKVN